jgi:hypothetical protein
LVYSYWFGKLVGLRRIGRYFFMPAFSYFYIILNDSVFKNSMQHGMDGPIILTARRVLLNEFYMTAHKGLSSYASNYLVTCLSTVAY